jgi:Putative Flp pilus-assembly TadE/G-like
MYSNGKSVCGHANSECIAKKTGYESFLCLGSGTKGFKLALPECALCVPPRSPVAECQIVLAGASLMKIQKNRAAGQALVLVTLSLLVLTGVIGLAIDMGYMRYTKRRLQTAADSAAVAGASELKIGNYQAAAFNDSKSNGFENGVNGVKVVTSHPPKDPPFSEKKANDNYVEVEVRQDAPTFFMRIFGVKKAALSATAVAELGSSRGCIYSLALLDGISVQGNVNAPGCGVVDNALLSIGGGCITASSIGVVLRLIGGGCTTPQPIVGIAPTTDPLAYLVPPQVPACNPTMVDVNSNNNNGNKPTTLMPGCYSNGIRIRNTNTAPVTFEPGVYYITGGVGLQFGGSGNISGDGVVFYVTNSAPVNMNSSGNVNLSAPTGSVVTGVPGGILIYQDRGDALNASINGALTLNGALYFPGAQLKLGGNLNSNYTIIVAQVIQFNGNFGIGSDYASLPEGSPVKAAVLVQ